MTQGVFFAKPVTLVLWDLDEASRNDHGAAERILSEAENWGYRGTTRFAIKQEYGHHFIRAEF